MAYEKLRPFVAAVNRAVKPVSCFLQDRRDVGAGLIAAIAKQSGVKLK